MIISASRRTDIPAFYAEWFIKRIRASYCAVPNPFNRNQVTRVSLLPKDVEVIVFWTRNPRPLFPYLQELDQLGFKYYFQFTVLDNPREIDPKSPPVQAGIRAFQDLAQRIGPERVIWRYDPIVFTEQTGTAFHREAYKRIAEAFHGATHRSVISIMDQYAKARGRMSRLPEQGYRPLNAQESAEAVRQLIPDLVNIAGQQEMEIVSCAEELDLLPYGVRPGKCVDDDYIARVFGIEVGSKKDPSQRKECGCVVSKDIGMYDSCLFGCQYCYATQSFDLAHRHHDEHNPDSPSLVGWYEPNQASKHSTSKPKGKASQMSLFEEEA